jgi:hypothetical protein
MWTSRQHRQAEELIRRSVPMYAAAVNGDRAATILPMTQSVSSPDVARGIADEHREHEKLAAPARFKRAAFFAKRAPS